jgi:signal transduction histidine kinase/PAS domain-containing protein
MRHGVLSGAFPMEPTDRHPVADCLAGGGEMGARMRSLDWAATPLGPVERWPQSLRSALSILLPSKAQIIMFWGPELVALYNDAYRPVFGGKHPGALGQPARRCWSEIWEDVLGPLLESVVQTGEAFWARDHPFIIERHGYVEETYFDISYDPVRGETGGVTGVFCIVSETTGRVLGERRLRTLRDLGAAAGGAKSAEEACRIAAKVLGENRADVPFALLYLIDLDGRRGSLVATVGLEPGTPASLESFDPGAADDAAGWPLAAACRTGETVVVGDVRRRFGPLPGGPWPDSPSSALVLPLAAPGQERLAGVLVAGVSPRRPLDDEYRSFFDVAAGRVAAAIADARAYEAERRRAEALAELDRAKTAFFSNVSHEFRTPLTLMLGPLEDLLGAPGVPADVRERLDLIQRNGVRLLALVNALLDFSRIEAGRAEAVYEPTDLAAYTAELASVFRSAVERAGLRLVVRCGPLSGPVYVDRGMWEKIVLNLLSNAFKFTFEGEITVSVSQAADHAFLEVRDTGIGIPAAELPNVFERFHRVRGVRGRTHEGTGIGLALVQELIRLHAGSVSVTSEPGTGTTFTVAIPTGAGHLPPERIRTERAPASTSRAALSHADEALRWLPGEGPAEPHLPSPGLTGTPGARVLLADDNADMREYVRRLLARHWAVEAVADGEAALAAARARTPDLVLTDVMMAGLDGFGLLRELRADPRTRTVPVILLSARAGEESRVEGLDAGADDYLIKPFSARELVARVSARLELARLRREAIAREREARAQAEAASQAKDDFLATLSHELRSPLNAILGWAQVLRARKSEPEMMERALQTIERNARLQTRLVEDLLDVSRIVSGGLRLDLVRVELLPLLESAIEATQPVAADKGIHLTSRLDPWAEGVLGDQARLDQVFRNLLSNAVKFTPPGGRVDVTLTAGSGTVQVAVTDTGLGIRPDFLPHVFDRFRQADTGPTRAHGGLGLGLAIVHHIVTLHGGTVVAESAGEGHGAQFTVTLPTAKPVA